MFVITDRIGVMTPFEVISAAAFSSTLCIFIVYIPTERLNAFRHWKRQDRKV